MFESMLGGFQSLSEFVFTNIIFDKLVLLCWCNMQPGLTRTLTNMFIVALDCFHHD